MLNKNDDNEVFEFKMNHEKHCATGYVSAADAHDS